MGEGWGEGETNLLRELTDVITEAAEVIPANETHSPTVGLAETCPFTSLVGCLVVLSEGWGYDFTHTLTVFSTPSPLAGEGWGEGKVTCREDQPIIYWHTPRHTQRLYPHNLTYKTYAIKLVI